MRAASISRRHPTPRGAITIAGAIALGLLVGNCGDASAGRPTAPVTTDRSAPSMLDLSGRRLPIERYLLTDRQLGELSRARTFLAANCLSRYGLTLPPAVFDSGTTPAADTSSSANTAHRYGIADPTAAARFGYHPPPGTPTPPPHRPEPRLSAAVELVLTGKNGALSSPESTTTYQGRPIPEGGCMDEATRRLGTRSGTIGDAQLANDVNLDSFARSKTEPATAKAIHAWSTCMRAAGFEYADPTEAPGPRFGDAPRATSEEIAVATADVACKRRTNLVGYWFTAEQAYQERAIRNQGAKFEQIRQELQTKTTLARIVLETGKTVGGDPGELTLTASPGADTNGNRHLPLHGLPRSALVSNTPASSRRTSTSPTSTTSSNAGTWLDAPHSSLLN